MRTGEKRPEASFILTLLFFCLLSFIMSHCASAPRFRLEAIQEEKEQLPKAGQPVTDTTKSREAIEEKGEQPHLGNSSQDIPADNNHEATQKKGEILPEGVYQIGVASYYGRDFHNRNTACGEPYDMFALTCAHLDLPFGTRIRVTNLDNGKWVIVRVNDRGPYVEGRILDLSYGAAKEIGLVLNGTAEVKIEIVNQR